LFDFLFDGFLFLESFVTLFLRADGLGSWGGSGQKALSLKIIKQKTIKILYFSIPASSSKSGFIL
jgi:hypothetical protein